jgi:hypothetical protein
VPLANPVVDLVDDGQFLAGTGLHDVGGCGKSQRRNAAWRRRSP